MLRIGKNSKDQDEHEKAPEKQDAYSTPKTYSSYQNTSPETNPTAAETLASSSRAVTESESLARDIKEGTLSGFVGSGTVLTGEATFKAMMRVDGHMTGRISSSSGTLIVGANGKVDANIEVAIAMIHGTINGDIIATQRLELGRAAKVNGNISAPSLVIEQGAIFEGSCKMLQASEKARKDKKAEEQPLGTSTAVPSSTNSGSASATSMNPITTDPRSKPSDVSNVSKMAS